MPLDDKRLHHTSHWQDTYVMPTYDSLASWQSRATHIKHQVLFAAALLPFPEKSPLNPIVTRTHQFDGFSVDNVAFESFPGFFCTGNVYKPAHPVDPRKIPVVLTPHGHWQEGRFAQRDTGSIPARCINFARQGYYAFAPDMVGYNDSRQIGGHRTFDSELLGLWGIGTLGLQLWNNIRALDYLLSLPGADPDRVACTGESGGATQTYLLAAVDDRVKFSAPVNMLSAHYAGGCVCENAPGLRVDLTNMEIIASFAPRPQFIVAATGDWTVNTPRVEYPAVRSIYQLCGAEDALECVQFDAPHNYNQSSREAVYGFLAKHLGGRGEPTQVHPTATFVALHSTPLAETPGSYIEDVDQLRVFPDSLPPNALEGPSAVIAAAQRFFGSEPPSGPTAHARFAERLRVPYQLALGATVPDAADLVIAHRQKSTQGDLEFERFDLGTKRHREQLPAILIRPAGTAASPAAPHPATPVLLLHTDGRNAWLDLSDPANIKLGSRAMKLLAEGHSILAVDLFLTGAYLTPISQVGRPASDPHFTTYNRTDDALRVQDILTAAAALAHLTSSDHVDVIAESSASAWATIAHPLAVPLIRHLDAHTTNTEIHIPHLPRLGGLQTALALAPGTSDR